MKKRLILLLTGLLLLIPLSAWARLAQMNDLELRSVRGAEGISLEEAVLSSIYLMVNARVQTQSMQLGDVKYLTSGEADLNSQYNQPPVANERAWEYLCKRVQDKS